jgi:GrpB-like predicted nucleotidyltransferase (UPF0157 family)
MVNEEKELDDLTIEELGQLFPIEIVPYDKKWSELFLEEKKLIQRTLGEWAALRIEHFGSTAIEGLAAKPIIDILVEIPQLTDELKDKVMKAMKGIGYHFIWRTDEQPPYMNFVKGYTLNGFEGNVFHIHMADETHSLWDRIYFRDYLRKNINVAKEYENLKIELAVKNKFNRDAYTNEKSDFVKRITEIAKNEIGCC